MSASTESLRPLPEGLLWSYLRQEDVPAWTELTNVAAAFDRTEEYYEPEDLAEELQETGFTPERDSWAVWHGDDLVAYGQLRVSFALTAEGQVRCNPDGDVHPQWRGRGIGSELIARQEARARELAAERFEDAEAFVRVSGGLEGSGRRPFFAARGYQIVRYFQDLARELPGPALAIEASGSAHLISPDARHENAVLAAHTSAFADHWGVTAQTPERWHDFWTARSFRPDLSTIAVDHEGAVLCYVLAGVWVKRHLYVQLVGTVPEARGRGLAAACLARTIALGSRAGEFDVVELDVDAASPTGANRLYERLGFTVTRTIATMQKAL